MPDFAHTFTIDEKNAYENQKGVQKGKEVGKILCCAISSITSSVPITLGRNLLRQSLVFSRFQIFKNISVNRKKLIK